MSQDHSKTAAQPPWTTNDTPETHAVIAQFWRQIGRIIGPPVVAGALLVSGCGDGDGDSTPKEPVDTMDVVMDADTGTEPDTNDQPDFNISVQDGRPFLVDGAIRRSPMQPGAGWGHFIDIPVAALNVEQRAVLSAYWLRVAQGEHASIAAFGRFTLELLHLGASDDLLTQTADALRDEVRHARMALSMASTYAGHPIAPGALDISNSLDSATDAATILRDTIVGGCINETLAVAQLQAAVARTQVPVVQTMLKELAVDESRHAALAWQTAGWILERWPELRPVADEAFAQASHPAPSNPETVDAALETHGYLTPTQRHTALVHAMKTVVEPCKQTLLG